MALPESCLLFKGLWPRQMDALEAISTSKAIRAGQWLFQEDEPAKALFILKSGTIELVTTADKDLELPLKILRLYGDCCGIAALIPPYQYNLSARCLKDADLFEINKNDLKSLFHKDNQVGMAIMSNLSRHLLDRLNEARRELRIHFKTLSDHKDVL